MVGNLNRSKRALPIVHLGMPETWEMDVAVHLGKPTCVKGKLGSAKGTFGTVNVKLSSISHSNDGLLSFNSAYSENRAISMTVLGLHSICRIKNNP